MLPMILAVLATCLAAGGANDWLVAMYFLGTGTIGTLDGGGCAGGGCTGGGCARGGCADGGVAMAVGDLVFVISTILVGNATIFEGKVELLASGMAVMGGDGAR